jgi:divalent metal cation (Fe/Co/Zn/Cd) transporter
MLGFPLADPIVGLLISAAILVLLWGTVRSIGRRLMDGIEPDLVDTAQKALEGTPGVRAVPRLQLRWSGHRLQGAATLVMDDGVTLADAEQVTREAAHRLKHALPKADDMVLTPLSATR